ncbi:beta-1,3-galactosyltransferase 1-like [Sycon ciliatum]|uniref:beta-1,3-galactosyltransferase 1-like n=1 Tax=Sycon ciliatum TaxID=27933 RepID=UPI0031F70F7E
MNVTKAVKQLASFALGIIVSWCCVRLASMRIQSDGLTSPQLGVQKEHVLSQEVTVMTEVHIDFTNPDIKAIVNRQEKAFRSSNASQVYLVVLIKSFAKNKLSRDALRTSWFIRDTKTYRPVPSKLIRQYFLVGDAEDEDTEQQLKQEQREFVDIIRVPFSDNYDFLAPKVFYGLQYAAQHLEFEYALVADQDTLVNWQTLLPWMASHPRRNLYAGKLVKDRPVNRDPAAKFHVPKEIYAPAKYPPVAAGFGYLMSSDVVHGLLSAMEKHALVGEDDAMVGVIASSLGVQVTDVGAFQVHGACTVKFPMVLAGVSGSGQMTSLHQKGLQRLAVCG